MGSGAVGGVFTPSMFVGAALGQLLALMIPGGTHAGAAAGRHDGVPGGHQPGAADVDPDGVRDDAGARAAAAADDRRGGGVLHGVALPDAVALQRGGGARAGLGGRRARPRLQLAGLCDPTDTVIDPGASVAQAADKFAETGTRYLYLVDAGALMGQSRSTPSSARNAMHLGKSAGRSATSAFRR
jgi:CIC family chloride channel protein